MTFDFPNLPIFSLFSKDNCVKNGGNAQEGVDFDENNHNSLEPGGWLENTVHNVCSCNLEKE